MELQIGCNALSKTITLLVSIGLLPVLSMGQANLVPNSSFEEYNFCSNIFDGDGKADDWFVPPQGYTPDYFNVCSQLATGSVPDNAKGVQLPHFGNAYMGLFTFTVGEPNTRDAISCALTSSLVQGHSYVFRAFLSLADDVQFSTTSIGFLLTSDPLIDQTPIHSYTPTFFNQSVDMSDTESWSMLTDTIVAVGGESYLTIANFNVDSLSDTVFVGNGGSIWNSAYYYIDDVSLIPLDSLLSVYVFETVSVDVYPNPVTDILHLRSKERLEVAYLMDMQGRQLMYMRKEDEWTADIGHLPAGIYLLKVVAEDGRQAVRKVVVQH